MPWSVGRAEPIPKQEEPSPFLPFFPSQPPPPPTDGFPRGAAAARATCTCTAAGHVYANWPRSLGSRVKTAAGILDEGIKSKREPRSQSEGDDTWFLLLLLLTDGSHVVGCVNTLTTVHHALHDTQASYALFLAELGGVESVGDRRTV